MNLSSHIPAYLEDMESAWSQATLQSESARLNGLKHVIDQGPKALHAELQARGLKPYTIKTTLTRVACLEAWAKAGTKYADWIKKHKNRLKYAYQKEEIELSYDEAVERISRISNLSARAHAMGLLTTGLRLSESYGVVDQKVIGKGGKPRKVYGKIEITVPKHTLWRELKAVGLKPHTLRKLCATRLAEKGASAADLMKVFGWSDIRIASSYLQAKDDERLQTLMEES